MLKKTKKNFFNKKNHYFCAIDLIYCEFKKQEPYEI